MRVFTKSLWIAVAFLVSMGAGCVYAQSLSVSPTKLAVSAPGNQAILVIKASGKAMSIVQARVMAWNEKDDPAKMTPTRNVVISPPSAKLKSGQELSLRIVRVAKIPLRGKECYRVLVDRLPDPVRNGEGIRLQIRHSIPLCFTP